MKYLLMLLMTTTLWASDQQSKKRVEYKYKKYEKFDLGNLEVKGKILAPGDISVRQRKRKRFRRDIYKRDNFRDLIYRDLIFQR